MKFIFKTVMVIALAVIAMMQSLVGILIEEQLTTVMLNSADNRSSRQVAAYECKIWSLRSGEIVTYVFVKDNTSGCPRKAFWEIFTDDREIVSAQCMPVLFDSTRSASLSARSTKNALRSAGVWLVVRRRIV